MDVVDFVNSQPANQRFGIELQEAADGRAVGVLDFDDHWCFSFEDNQYLHGGVSFGLADTVGAAAVMSHYETVRPAVTKDLRIDYLRVAGGDLRAIAEVNRYGRSDASVDVEVVDRDTGGQIALARGIYATE